LALAPFAARVMTWRGRLVAQTAGGARGLPGLGTSAELFKFGIDKKRQLIFTKSQNPAPEYYRPRD